MLFINGCDHQPIQRDLSEAIRTARKLYPDTDFVHSNVADYLQAVGRSLGPGAVRREGRAADLKQMNQQGQALLEKVAEPLGSFAYLLGKEYMHICR